MMKTIRVSEKGQIAIPQPMRETLGIEKGDELVVIQIENKILLEKAQKMEQKLKDEFKDIIKFSERSLKEVWDNKSDDMWSQYLRGNMHINQKELVLLPYPFSDLEGTKVRPAIVVSNNSFNKKSNSNKPVAQHL